MQRYQFANQLFFSISSHRLDPGQSRNFSQICQCFLGKSLQIHIHLHIQMNAHKMPSIIGSNLFFIFIGKIRNQKKWKIRYVYYESFLHACQGIRPVSCFLVVFPVQVKAGHKMPGFYIFYSSFRFLPTYCYPLQLLLCVSSYRQLYIQIDFCPTQSDQNIL